MPGADRTATVVATLRREHRSLAALLNALERQVRILAEGGAPDYDIVRGAVDYLLDYPDRCHHPKEDIVIARLLEVRAREAVAARELRREHRDLHARAEHFASAVSALLNDTDIPRAAVVEAVGAFIDAQRRHMWREEETFFPLAERLLSASDWAAIEAELELWSNGPAVRRSEAAFAHVSERLLAWEREDESPPSGPGRHAGGLS